MNPKCGAWYSPDAGHGSWLGVLFYVLMSVPLKEGCRYIHFSRPDINNDEDMYPCANGWQEIWVWLLTCRRLWSYLINKVEMLLSWVIFGILDLLPKQFSELASNMLGRVKVKYTSSLPNCVPLGLTWSFAECKAESFSWKEKEKGKGFVGGLLVPAKLVSPEHAWRRKLMLFLWFLLVKDIDFWLGVWVILVTKVICQNDSSMPEGFISVLILAVHALKEKFGPVLGHRGILNWVMPKPLVGVMFCILQLDIFCSIRTPSKSN